MWLYSFCHKPNGFLLKSFHFTIHDSENKDSLQVKYGKVQSSNSKVSEDRTDNVDNTANLKNADMLHIDSLTSNINVHFPIDITTSQEISSMNQSNCISAKSLQRFQRWKPGLEPKECWINDEVCFTRGT